MDMTRGSLFAFLFAVATLAAASATLGPIAASASVADSFAGHCALHGIGTFSPALTPTPGPATLVNQSTGTCSGTLGDKAVTNAAVTLTWAVSVYASGCVAAHTTAPGPGTLTFADGTAISFTAEFTGVLTEYPLTIHGESSGAALGLANLLTTQTSPTAVLQCAGLDGGLTQTPVDVTFATLTPLVTGTATATDQATTSFTGTCQLTGTVAFQPALTLATQSGRVNVTAPGTCSGQLTLPDGASQSLHAQPATINGASQGSESCELGDGTGAADLTLAGQALHFTYSEIRAGPALALTATGALGGSALAEGNISPSANPINILTACTSTGLTQAPIDVRVVATALAA
jgi:hypothetical protein